MGIWQGCIPGDRVTGCDAGFVPGIVQAPVNTLATGAEEQVPVKLVVGQLANYYPVPDRVQARDFIVFLIVKAITIHKMSLRSIATPGFVPKSSLTVEAGLRPPGG